jgi:acetyl-CoA acetyltransferase
MTGHRFEDRVVISGVGQSDVGRRLARTGLELTVDATLAALADAGLEPGDIDGLASYPSIFHPAPGFAGAGLFEVKEALGIELSWYLGAAEAAQLTPVTEACLAVAGGLANHVVCFRTVTEATAQGERGRATVMRFDRAGDRVEGLRQWTVPYGAVSPANWLAMYAQRYFHEFGATREQLGQVAINARRNAALNPAAIRREPMSLANYLDARMISEPLCLLDCDIPVDGSTAVVVSRVDSAPDLRRPPVRIEAVGTGLRGRFSWDNWADLTTMASLGAAEAMWSRTSLRPVDVDIAQLYDGFSILTLIWLESMGFCGRGEAASFVEGGARIARDGPLPLNTQGGQLSAGRLHGFGYLHEACLQLWGLAGERQLSTVPQVAAVGVGGGPYASALLLTGPR